MEHILKQTGFVVLEDCFPLEAIDRFLAVFDVGWAETKERMLAAKENWKVRRYHVKGPLFFLGGAQYEGKRCLDLGDSFIVDLGHGRYDWGASDQASSSLPCFEPLVELVNQTEPIQSLVTRALGEGFSSYVGALPVDKSDPIPTDGMWHRDALPLFDEAIDLGLPPFYMTLIIPLVDIGAGDGGTEVVPGSQAINLQELGVADAETLAAWAEGQIRVTPNLTRGSALLFDGRTVHRGTKTMRKDGQCRSALYVVFHKNWYDDDTAYDFSYK